MAHHPRDDLVAQLPHLRAFARLGPRHREVLVLAGVHGLPYERIAEVCGCELGPVKSRANRARNLLKAMLLGEGGSLKAGAAAAERLLGRGDRLNQVLVRDGGHDVSPAVRGSGHQGLSPGHLSR